MITAYRRIYLLTPRASEVPDAWLAIAQLYTEMGEHFGGVLPVGCGFVPNFPA